jgi:hypothetical protein
LVEISHACLMRAISDSSFTDLMLSTKPIRLVN